MEASAEGLLLRSDQKAGRIRKVSGGLRGLPEAVTKRAEVRPRRAGHIDRRFFPARPVQGARKHRIASRHSAEVARRIPERGHADKHLQPTVFRNARVERHPQRRHGGHGAGRAVFVSGRNIRAGQRGQHGRIDRNRRNDRTQRRSGVLGGGRDDELGDGVAGRGGFRVCGNSERQIQSGGAY